MSSAIELCYEAQGIYGRVVARDAPMILANCVPKSVSKLLSEDHPSK